MPRPATLVEIATTPMDSLGIPAKSIRLDVGPGRKAFVFTMAASTRTGMAPERLRSLVQNLGDLVHPASAVMVILPDGKDLTAYKLEVA